MGPSSCWLRTQLKAVGDSRLAPDAVESAGPNGAHMRCTLGQRLPLIP